MFQIRQEIGSKNIAGMVQQNYRLFFPNILRILEELLLSTSEEKQNHNYNSIANKGFPYKIWWQQGLTPPWFHYSGPEGHTFAPQSKVPQSVQHRKIPAPKQNYIKAT